MLPFIVCFVWKCCPFDFTTFPLALFIIKSGCLFVCVCFVFNFIFAVVDFVRGFFVCFFGLVWFYLFVWFFVIVVFFFSFMSFVWVFSGGGGGGGGGLFTSSSNILGRIFFINWADHFTQGKQNKIYLQGINLIEKGYYIVEPTIKNYDIEAIIGEASNYSNNYFIVNGFFILASIFF